MLKSITLAAAALAAAGTALPSAASAQGYFDDGYAGGRSERAYGVHGYEDRYCDEYRPAPRDRHAYRDRRCDTGTGGTVIGAIAGGLLGNAVAGRRDRTLGILLGAVGGGLAGRAIDRSDNPHGCR